MQLLLTDRLSCPRCGPSFGLILRADRLVERRVIDGVLGCPNCRDSFRIVDGFADLREPPRGDLVDGLAGRRAPWGGGEAEVEEDVPDHDMPDHAAATVDAEMASRIVALLGIPRGPGTALLVGEAARVSGRLADTVEDLDVVVVDPDTRFWPEHSRVSRIVGAPGLPFFTRMLRGVAVDARLGEAVLVEAARVIGPGGRVVAIHADAAASEVLRGAGLAILAEEGETVVAARS